MAWVSHVKPSSQASFLLLEAIEKLSGGPGNDTRAVRDSYVIRARKGLGISLDFVVSNF